MTDFLKESIRTVPNFPIEGVQFRDITSIIEDPELFNSCVVRTCFHAHKFTPDVVIGIESRGFIFGVPVAQELRLPFIPARKPGKLPNETVGKDFDLEYGSTSVHLQKISPIKGRVVIVDDLIATGGTAMATADLVHEHFDIPKSDIMILAIIDLPDLGGSAKLLEQGYAVKTLMEFEGE